MTDNPFAGCRHVVDVAAALGTAKFVELLTSGYEFCKVLLLASARRYVTSSATWSPRDISTSIDAKASRV
jgi:hypothetical protein